MSTVGIAMMKNEADVVEGVVRHMAWQCDWVVVADNNSTDGTRAILDRLVAEKLNLTVVDDPVIAYRQSEKMTALAAQAAELEMDDGDNDTWIVAFDADELFYSPTGRPLYEVLPGLPWWVVRAPLYNHLRTALDVDDPDPFRSMVWRQRDPGALPKVAFRWQPGAVIEQGNHGVWLPDPGPLSVYTGPDQLVALRHFPVRSAEQMISKAVNGGRAYEADPTINPDWGGHWRAWYRLWQGRGDAALHEAYREHWFYKSPADAMLIEDPAPYRLDEFES